VGVTTKRSGLDFMSYEVIWYGLKLASVQRRPGLEEEAHEVAREDATTRSV
jgi:hypothetical protein